MDENRIIHIESSRSGWWISVALEKGTIQCKKCGTNLQWDKNKIGD